jgi:hypothetical protein
VILTRSQNGKTGVSICLGLGKHLQYFLPSLYSLVTSKTPQIQLTRNFAVHSHHVSIYSFDYISNTTQGRGHYEEEVIRDLEVSDQAVNQQYNSRGYPRNPTTKRKERDNVRAANEVMQTTGVVEDAEIAKIKFLKAQDEKNQETLTALRLIEGGRAVLVGGVWGVLGLRRRILVGHTWCAMDGVFLITFSSINHMQRLAF